MKKIFISITIILSIFILTGCKNTNTIKGATEDYLNKYVTLDNTILNELNDFIDKEELTNDQKVTYKEILKRQYSALTYDILNETYTNDEEAIVTVKITVYNLNKTQKEATEYLNSHKDEFLDKNGEYDREKFITYKLDNMKNTKDTIDYEMNINVIKRENKWQVTQLSKENLDKIHGIYEIEEE